MRRHWHIWIVIAVLAVLATMLGRIRWAISVPSRPKTLPATAIWIPAPLSPLDLSPRGYWLACWLDAARNVNRCTLTDYKGNPSLDENYSPLTGPNPVPEARLHLKSVSSEELWTPVGQELVPIAHLQDGTVLVPIRVARQLRERYTSK